MANLPEADEFPAGVYQLETTDPVLGGPPNEATKAGVDNIPHQQLAKRTRWLKSRVDTLLGRVINTTGLAIGGGDMTVNRTISVPVASQAEAETGTENAKAMTPLRVAQAIANRLRVRNIAVSGLATGGGSLDADRTIGVPVASQAEAEAGIDNTKAMTPLRVGQYVWTWFQTRLVDSVASTSTTGAATPNAVKQANDNANTRVPQSRSIGTTGLASGGGDLTQARVIDVPEATQAEAEAGIVANRAMTPRRVRQAIAAQMAAVAAAAGFVVHHSGNFGYISMPSWLGGLCLGWGIVTITEGGAVGTDVSLPVSFLAPPRVALAIDRGIGAHACSVRTVDASTIHISVRNHAGYNAGATVSFFVMGF